jgi:transcriptional regulator with XRE-family HTH domain
MGRNGSSAASHGARTAAENLSNRLGERVLAIRRQRGFMLREVAARTGVSIAMLSMIERGRSNPSIGTLHALADAFGVRMSELLQSIEPPDQDSIIRRSENQEVIRATAGVERRIRIDDPERGYELAENRYEPGTASSPVPLHHQGYEFGFVLEGQLEVTVEDRVHVARTGDSIKLDSNLPHRFRNPGPHVTRTLWVNITHPERSHKS